MTPLEDRLRSLEEQVTRLADMDRLGTSLLDRLDRIEQAIKPSATATAPAADASGRTSRALRGFAGWMGAELPKFITAAVLLLIGFGIKDSVDLSIKQRQLDLSYAKEMQGLLQKMGEASAEMTQLQSTAVVLASYGEASLPPLMSELRAGGLRAEAATAGVRVLSLTRPEAVCETLPRVLAHRGRQFDWQGQQKVVEILGENGCAKAIEQLAAYRQIVAAASEGKTAAFAEVVRELPLSPPEDYPRLLKTIDRSIALLKR